MNAHWNWLPDLHRHADEPDREQAIPVFSGQKLVVVGGSSGMGRETAQYTPSNAETTTSYSSESDIPLHLFGVKLGILQQAGYLPDAVVSLDSAAWSNRFGHGIDRSVDEQRRTCVPCRSVTSNGLGCLRLLREYPRELRLLARRARLLTPTVADRVAVLARSNPDAALEAFTSAFQRQHFELDESAFDQGFEFWAEGATDFILLLMRGTDRCNGIEATGFRPGYALQWALIQEVFYDDERSQIVAEVAETFGEELADRIESVQPPQHQVLCRRLARSPYVGMASFSRWALGDVSLNPLIWTWAPPPSSKNVVYMSST